eukprot:CAMPEP_0197589094 /NCGR_PEP_ID=MMETSP1326-20131121/10148_1 /TAXON_ID=1155430 /ORGANISM="Genus nov. species nov., Strain RCC2288" /LENGTH=258 /DNA_ID=CAMNT_0043153995 /DNA_START=150 /DNA_END=926 /DNA_ORIENTATION=+
MMTFSSSKSLTIFALLFISLVVVIDHASAASHDAHDDHGAAHICACEAKEMGFTIDCANMAPVTAAVAYLKATPSCVETTKAADCEKNYLTLQSHHDFCPPDSLPTNLETIIHAYEEFFSDCFIPRQYNSKLGMCPAFDCAASNMAANLTAATTFLTNNCTTACASAECKAAFQSVYMAHDTCDEKMLPGTVETALHAFEDVCAANNCNTRNTPYDLATVVCPAAPVASAAGGAPRGGSVMGNVLALAAAASASVFVF